MKPTWRCVRPGVHFTDVDGVVAGLGQRRNPTALPGIGILEDAGGVRVVASKETGSGRGAGGGGDVALVEGDAFLHQSIEIGRVDVIVAGRADGVEALLVGDDEYDVGSFFLHYGSTTVKI